MLEIEAALAAAHGHEWATTRGGTERFLTGRWESEEEILDAIAEQTRRERHPGSLPGIVAPGWDEEKEVFEHTTGTGRLRWSVGWDGEDPTVLLEVHRPEGLAFYVLLTKWGDVWEAEWTLPQEGDFIPFGQRHLDAVRRALRALRKLGMEFIPCAPPTFQEIADINDSLETIVNVSDEKMNSLAREYIRAKEGDN